MLTMTEPDITLIRSDIAQNPADIYQKPLKPKHLLFVKEYILTKNASLSAKNAGYISKQPHVMGYRLMRIPAIKAAIEAHEAKELAKIEEKIEQVEVNREISREKYVDTTWKEFETTDAEKDKTNRLRALELSGKALGFIGSSGDKNTTNNNLTINIDAKSLSTADKWERLRALIDGS